MPDETPNQGNVPGAHRTSNTLFLLAPSILLCTIALRQIWLAKTDTLSPWKGGGFGMFSCADTPGNRFLQVTGWTTEGEEVRVRVAASAPFGIQAGLLQRLRAYPREADLRTLADALVDARFVESTAGELARREAFFHANPELASSFPSLPEHPRRQLVLMDRRRQGHYSAEGEQLRSVEVAVWRFAFDADDLSVRTERMLGPIAVDAPLSAASLSSSQEGGP